VIDKVTLLKGLLMSNHKSQNNTLKINKIYFLFFFFPDEGTEAGVPWAAASFFFKSKRISTSGCHTDFSAPLVFSCRTFSPYQIVIFNYFSKTIKLK
jgi:hypothetical protein